MSIEFAEKLMRSSRDVIRSSVSRSPHFGEGWTVTIEDTPYGFDVVQTSPDQVSWICGFRAVQSRRTEVDLSALSVCATSNDLDQILCDLNESGVEPVVVGFDARGRPFLAYGWAPGGDGWDAGIVQDDTHSSEFEYSDGTKRCEECGAFERRGIDKLDYPVRVH